MFTHLIYKVTQNIVIAGELGWEIYVERHQVKELYEALLNAGQEFGVGDFGTYAMASMRIEKGFRAWGADVIYNILCYGSGQIPV